MSNITHRLVKAAVCLGLAVVAAPVSAQDLDVPTGAVVTRDLVQDPGAYALPVGPWTRDGGVPVDRVEGRVHVQALRIDGTSATPLQIVLPLRDQLEEQGFRVVLDCAARTCGGFDFRFDTFVLPAPQMAVDLTNYHVLSMRAEDGSAVSLLASRAGTAAYVQIVRAGTRGGSTQGTAPRAAAVVPSGGASGADVSLSDMLQRAGHAVLPGLVYASGSANLGEGSVASLDDLAGFLTANPQARVVLVGHTDATGSLEANTALSRQRAEAAERYLVQRHGIDPSRLSAEGAGYLAPVASNLTAEGRERNRRVEVVLLP